MIKQYQSKPEQAPTSQALHSEELQQQIIAAVKEHLTQGQQSLLQDEEQIDIADVVAKTTALVVDNTIDIPRIIVTPKGTVTSGYRAFTLDVSGIKGLKPQERSLVSQSLQTNEQTEIGEGDSGNYEPIKENYILKKLFDYDDIPYDEHAELLYDLAKQAVECLSAVNDEKDVENILQNQSDVVARLIHAQMDKHFYEEATEYEVEVRSGFTTLKECSYTAAQGQDVKSYRDTVTEVSKIKQMLFGGFKNAFTRYRSSIPTPSVASPSSLNVTPLNGLSPPKVSSKCTTKRVPNTQNMCPTSLSRPVITFSWLRPRVLSIKTRMAIGMMKCQKKQNQGLSGALTRLPT